MNRKSIVITGATGVVGSAVVRRALDKGMDVLCIVHPGSKRMGNLPVGERLRIVEYDLCEYKTLARDSHYDAFIHLSWEKTFGASRDDAEVQARNIQYTLDACHLARRCGCGVFVGAGSQAEFGLQSVSLVEGLPMRPESGYGIAKYAAGKLASLLCAQLGIRFNWARILSVYGPNDGENTLISYLIKELRSGRSPQLTKCEQMWDYLYADDAGDALLAIADKGIDGRFYTLGSGNGRPLSTFVEEVRQAINPDVEMAFGAKPYYPHQPMFLVADVSSLKKDTGWSPRFSFSEGLQSML